MKKNPAELTNALDHVDPHRRGFLSKMLAGGVALPAMTSLAFGATQQNGQGKGGKGKGGGGKGKGGTGGRGSTGKGGTGRDRDPATVAAQMIKDFDKDGDKKLSLAELTNALKAMQEKQQRGTGKGRGGSGKGKGSGGGAGKGKGGNASAGGATPKRPGQ